MVIWEEIQQELRAGQARDSLSDMVADALPPESRMSPAPEGMQSYPDYDGEHAMSVQGPDFEREAPRDASRRKVRAHDGRNLCPWERMRAHRSPKSLLARLVTVGTLLVLSCADVDRGDVAGISHALEPAVTFTLEPAVAVGTLPGAMSVEHDGSARYTIRLWVPPGRNSMEPSLALHYSSRTGRGPLGVGWSLSEQSSIERCTLAPGGFIQAVKLDASDAFCLDGVRLAQVGTVTVAGCSANAPEYRTIPDRFSRVVACGGDAVNGPSYWMVFDKSGLQHTYGTNGAFISANTADRNDVRAMWYLQQTNDRDGNYIWHTYEGSGPGGSDPWIRQKEIEYTGNADVAPTRTISFFYDDSDVQPASSMYGMRIRHIGRLTNVRVTASSKLLRDYRLAYDLGDASGRPLLVSVTACDGTASTARCMDPTTFTYTGNDAASAKPVWDATVTGDVDVNFTTDIAKTGSLQFADLNGDGRDDMLFWARGQWWVRPSVGSTFGSAIPMSVPMTLPSGVTTPPSLLYDYDFNGSVDLITYGQPSGGPQATRFFRLTAAGMEEDLGPLRPSAWWAPMTFTRLFRPTVAGRRPEPAPVLVFMHPGSRRFGFPVPDTSTFREGMPIRYFVAPTPYLDEQHLASTDEKVTFRDLDNDGIAEVLFSGKPSAEHPEGYFYITELSREYNGATLVATGRFSNLSGGGKCAVWADFTGDGLIDVINLSDENRDGFLSSADPPAARSLLRYDGRRFAAMVPLLPTGFVYPGCNPDYSEADRPKTVHDAGYHVVDYNGDGLNDLLVLGMTQNQFAENARVFVTSTDGTSMTPISLPEIVKLTPTSDWRDGRNSFTLDVDGDGQFDVVQMDARNHYILHRQTTPPPDLLLTAKNGLGALAEVKYASLLGSSIYSCSGRCDARPQWVVNELIVDDGVSSPPPAQLHSYADYRIDRHSRQSLGFAVHQVKENRDGADRVVRYRFEQCAASTCDGIEHPFLDEPAEVTESVKDIDDATWHARQSITKRRTSPASSATGAPYFVYTKSTETVRYAGPARDFTAPLASADPAFLLSRQIATMDTDPKTGADAIDAYGNVTRYNFDAGTGGTTTTVDTYRQADTATWLIGLRERSVVTGREQGSSGVRTTQWSYDARGHLIEAIREPDDPASGNLYQRTKYVYDGYGLLTTRMVSASADDNDPKNRVSRIEYGDPKQSADWYFPTALLNPLGHPTQLTYHPSLGELAAVRDANGVLTTFEYDTFGRPRFARKYVATFRETRYAKGDPSVPMRVTTGGSHKAETTVSLDRLGRPTTTRTKGFDGTYVNQDASYDTFGRVWKRSLPYRDNTTPVLERSTVYDRLGRPRWIFTDDGSTTTEFQYSGRTVSLREPGSDPNRRTVKSYDAAGRLISSIVYAGPSSTPAETTYLYGPFDQLIRVKDPEGNEVFFVSDAVGRPFYTVDADVTLSVTSHDRFDDVVGAASGSLTLTTYTYDKLGRPLTRKFPNVPSYDASWKYDDGIGAKGHLTRSTAANVVKDFSYDPQGRLETTQWTLSDHTRAVHYTYDDEDRLKITTYPTIEGFGTLEFEQFYNDTGQLSEVRKVGTSTPVWKLTAVNAAQAPLSEEFGGGNILETHVYNLNQTLQQVKVAIDIAPSGAAIFGEAYTYYPNRDLASRKDLFSSSNLESFGYDSAGRLISAQIGTKTRGWAYDALGNLTSINEPGLSGCTLGYGGKAGPHRLTSIACGATSYAFGYDAAGNTTSTPEISGVLTGKSLTYTRGNQLATVTSAGVTQEFQYDAEGIRVIKSQSDGRSGTEYIGREFEERKNQNHSVDYVTYVYAGSRPVMQQTSRHDWLNGTRSTEVRYLHQDRLGTPIVASIAPEYRQPGTLPAARYPFDAWGKRRNPSWGSSIPAMIPTFVKMGFIGHLHDDDLGLINMRGRVYDPTLKRFLTADPLIPEPSLGASWNRYSYVRNNPLRFVDPSGFQECANGTCYSPGDERAHDENEIDIGFGIGPLRDNDGIDFFREARVFTPRILVVQSRNHPGPGQNGPLQQVWTAPRSAPLVVPAVRKHDWLPTFYGSDTGNSVADAAIGAGGTVYNVGTGIINTIPNAAAELEELIERGMVAVHFSSSREQARMDLAFLTVATHAMLEMRLLVEGTAAGGSLPLGQTLTTLPTVSTGWWLGGRSGPSSQLVRVSMKSLQHFFGKHGKDFGLLGNWSNGRAAEVWSLINRFINTPGIQMIKGSYRDMDNVTHWLDPVTRLDIVVDSAGRFVSGWRLSQEQFESVFYTGRLW